ncbi:MAG TPA: AAA family ATPase [Chloroflexia bacterium]|nr:AAA family ATPase [Chloroflexia bacterium]
MAEAKFELYLLGSPELRRNGQPLNFDTRKALALLAYLAASERSQRRDTLAALLWEELDQSNARASLRRTLSTLNRGLEGAGLVVEHDTLALKADQHFWVDLTEFNRHLNEVKAQLARGGEITASHITGLEEAVALWRGEFMQGFSLRDSPEFEEWQSQVAENLRRDVTWSLEKLADRHAADHAYNKALDFTRRWLALDPLNETAYGRTMRYYAWNDQSSLALKAYRQCVQILERELGVPPLETTTELYEAIKQRRFEPPPPLTLSSAPPATASNVKTASNVNIQSETTGAVESLPVTGFPLVGRARQWQALVGAAQAVFQHGQGRLVVVEGEAGIGKTRLVEDFLEAQRKAGQKVTKVSCYEGEAEMAFVAVSAVLHTALSTLAEPGQLEAIELEWRQEAARLVPKLGAGLPAPPPLDTPLAQSHFYEGLRQTLLALCGSPGIVFLDDLQWIDGASLDFLAYLARRIPEQPLCLIMAWRSGTFSDQSKLAQVLSAARKQDYVTSIKLARLSRAEVEELVLAGLPGKRTEMAHILYMETEGLPYFVVEYVEAYRRGLLQTNNSEQEGFLAIPGGVRDLLESRLRSVGETARQLLQSAAVIGQGFDFDTLREVSGRSEVETIAGLEEVTAATLVVELAQPDSELRYDFSHEKLRSLVYEKTSPARRRLLHRRVAEALLDRKAGREALYGQIGYHFRQAGNETAAAHYYKLAGDYARSLFANREALNHYQTALALGHPDKDLLHEAAGDIYTLLGEYNAALHQYQLAFAGNSNARLEYKAGKIYLWRGDWESGISQFESAFRLASDEASLASQIYTDWSLALHHLNRDEEAGLLLEKALALAASSGDKLAEAKAYNIAGLLARDSKDAEKAKSALEASLVLSRSLGEQNLQAAALNNLARVWLDQGNLEKAIELTQAALELVTAQGDRHRQAALLSNLGDLYHATGQAENSRSCVKQSVSIYAEIELEAGTYQPGIWMLTDW